MANTARAFGEYRFVRAVVHYVTRQSTATAGEVAICFTENNLEPCEDGTVSTFLPRVMTRGAAVLGPLWQNHSMAITVDNVFRKVDAFNAANFNDNVAGEIQVYTQTPLLDTMGYLLIDYELEFKTTIFTPHSAALPFTYNSIYGPLTRVGNTAAGGGVALGSASTTLNALPNGTIARCIFDSAGSSFGLSDASNAFSFGTEFADGSGTETTTLTNLPFADGAVFYFVKLGTTFWIYTSIEAAISGSGSGQILWRNTNVSATYNIAVTSYIVRLGASELLNAD